MAQPVQTQAIAETGAQAILKVLDEQGVDRVFGYPGGCIMPLYDALLESDIEHVLCRHEQGCALAADGYARASGRLGVAIATSGPGATNLVTGVANAMMDSVPMLVITGQVPSAAIGTDAFQETDVLGLSLGITKHSYLVTDPDDIPRVMNEAIDLAKSGRPGPVWVDVSKDALLAPTNHPDTNSLWEPSISPARTEWRPSVARARLLMGAARRPLVYGGGGVSLARAEWAYRRFLEITGLPCVETLKGIGNAGRDYPWQLGMLGMHGSRAANTAVDEADLIICIGARFDDRATGKASAFASKAKIIHIDIDPSELHKVKQADIAIAGPMTDILVELAMPLDIAPWRGRCVTLKHQCGFTAQPHGEHHISGPALLRQLDATLPRDAVVTCDVGQHQMWVAQHMRFRQPRDHLSSGGLGTMGYGLPAALGAQFARPESTVINVSGDGSFLMNVQELATLRRYELPVKILLLDNRYLGLVRQQQCLFYGERFSECALDDNPDFAQVARSFGLAARRLSAPSDITMALDWLLAQKGPALLHVIIPGEQCVWPMVPPGAANTAMLEGQP